MLLQEPPPSREPGIACVMHAFFRRCKATAADVLLTPFGMVSNASPIGSPRSPKTRQACWASIVLSVAPVVLLFAVVTVQLPGTRGWRANENVLIFIVTYVATLSTCTANFCHCTMMLMAPCNISVCVWQLGVKHQNTACHCPAAERHSQSARLPVISNCLCQLADVQLIHSQEVSS